MVRVNGHLDRFRPNGYPSAIPKRKGEQGQGQNSVSEVARQGIG